MSGKIIVYFIVAVILAAIGYSCKSTNNVSSEKLLQKRKYRSGFYVNNHKKAKIKKQDLVFSSQEKLSKKELVVDKNPSINPIVEDEDSPSNKTDIRAKTNINKSDYPLESRSKLASNKTTKLENKLELNQDRKRSLINSDDQTDKKIEKNGLVSFILAFIGIITLIIALVIGSYGAIAPFFIFLALEGIALVLSLISLRKFRDYPDKYRGKDYAKVGLWFSLISLVGSIIFLIVIL